MTATMAPPTRPSAPPFVARERDFSPLRRTLITLLATAIGITPLKALLSDYGWLFEAWLTMVIVIAPAAVIRLWRPPGALDIWPGVLLLVPWLTALFVRQHAWGGFIPTGATLTDISHLMDSLHKTTRDEVAPVHSTVAVKLVVCALLGLLAALIDLIAVVGRRGALAGVPLLVVYTVSGAVPRTPVGWVWFVLAAAGFLLLLGLDADDELRHWGRRIGRRGSGRSRPGLEISAQRIGIIAIAVGLILPLLVPDHSRNLLADAFRNGNGNGVGGFGAGSGGGGSISPFVALKGQLDRSKAVKLMTVHIDGPSAPPPFYLKTNVLDRYTADVGWAVSGHGPTEPVGETTFGTTPVTEPVSTTGFRATITVSGLTGNAPVFATPIGLDGVDDGTTWSPQDQILQGTSVRKGQVFTEQVGQPQPSIDDLRSASPVDTRELRRWLELPKLPAYVTDLVARLTRGKATAYERARAISDYFADPANGFVYSLKTEPGDSGSALVDFLKNGTGYCQQYAAAMGVMLRAAGIPARIALGYMHPPADRRGDFQVTTFDAHAWVEAFFGGIGWVPFDPTPPSGLAGGRSSDLSWAPHVYASSTRDTRPTISTSATRAPGGQTGASSSTPAGALSPGSGSNTGVIWFGLAVLVLAGLALIPAGARTARRRRRYLAARRGDTDALWAELSDTATDLGYLWSPARSPRQVSAWLARDAGAATPALEALEALAAAVEQRRYAPGPTAGEDAGRLTRGLHEVAGQLRSRRSRRMRLQATFWPASLGWGRRFGGILPGLARHRR